MTYPGGKNGAGAFQTIISQMPPHELYIEPFLGSGAVLRMKRPAKASIAIDCDEDVVRSFLAKYSDWSGETSTTVMCDDGIRFLQHRRNWTGRELVYCDPPYLMSSRRRPRRIYRYELEERDHVELLATLKTLPCLVMVSGYDSPLYRAMLEQWRLVTFTAVNRAGRRTTEHLWMNFPEPAALHDYRYLGIGFRERERIKRRIQRWSSRLLAMTAIERKALTAALAEISDGGSADRARLRS